MNQQAGYVIKQVGNVQNVHTFENLNQHFQQSLQQNLNLLQMGQQQLLELQQLAKLIQDGHYGSNTEEIKQATNMLLETEQGQEVNVLFKLYQLIFLLSQPQQNFYTDPHMLKNIIRASFIRIQNLLHKMLQTMILSDPRVLLEMLAHNLCCLFHANVSQMIQDDHMYEGVAQILQFAEHTPCGDLIYKVYMEYENQQQQNSSQQQILIIQKLSKAITCICKSDTEFSLYLEGTFSKQFDMMNNSIAQLQQYLVNNAIDGTQIQFTHHIDTIKALSDTFSIIIQKFQKNKQSEMRSFMNNSVFLKMINDILNLQLSSKDNSILFILTLNEQFNICKTANLLKYNVFKIINCMLEYYLELQDEGKENIDVQVETEKNYVNFVEFIGGIQRLYQQQLIVLTQYYTRTDIQFEQLMQKEFYYSQNIHLLFQNFSYMVQVSKIYNQISESAKLIADQILIPLMCSTEKQRVDFVQNSEEFLCLENDMVQDQKSSTYQVYSAKILVEIAQNIDGQLYQITMFLINNLCKLTENINVKCNEVPLQTALLTLNVLNEEIIGRSDLLKEIERLFQYVCPYIIQNHRQMDGITIVRFQQLIKYYQAYIFIQNVNHFSDSFKFLFQMIQDYSNVNTIVSQSVDSLWGLINNDCTFIRIESTIRDFLPLLEQLTLNTQVKSYFEFLKCLVREFYSSLEPCIFTQVNTLVQRIQMEYQKNPNSQFIYDCLHILIEITDNDKYMDEAFLNFTDALTSLYGFLEQLDKIYFEKEILQIGCNHMKKTMEVMDLIQAIENAFPKFVQKYSDSSISDIFESMFYIFYYAGAYMIDDKKELLGNWYKLVIDSFKNIDFNKVITYQYEEFTNYFIALQIQTQQTLDFTSDYPFINSQLLLLSQVYTQFCQQNQQMYPVRLVQTFLGFLHYQPEITLAFMYKNKTFRPIIGSLITHYKAKFISYEYDRNILILGLIQLVQNQMLAETTDEETFELLKALIEVVQYHVQLATKQSGQQQTVIDLTNPRKKKNNVNEDYFDIDEMQAQQEDLGYEPGDSKNFFNVNTSDLDQANYKNYYLKPENDINTMFKNELKQMPLMEVNIMEKVLKFFDLYKQEQKGFYILTNMPRDLLDALQEVCKFQLYDNMNQDQKVTRKIVKVKKIRKNNIF